MSDGFIYIIEYNPTGKYNDFTPIWDLIEKGGYCHNAYAINFSLNSAEQDIKLYQTRYPNFELRISLYQRIEKDEAD